jgi:hypothetical protein
MKRTALLWFIGLLLMPALLAQEPPGAQERPSGPPGAAQAPAEPKAYDKVITKEAKTTQGIFLVHQIKEKWYYEIPKSELNKDFLWVGQIARTALGAGYGGQALGSRVVRWERLNNR